MPGQRMGYPFRWEGCCGRTRVPPPTPRGSFSSGSMVGGSGESGVGVGDLTSIRLVRCKAGAWRWPRHPCSGTCLSRGTWVGRLQTNLVMLRSHAGMFLRRICPKSIIHHERPPDNHEFDGLVCPVAESRARLSEPLARVILWVGSRRKTRGGEVISGSTWALPRVSAQRKRSPLWGLMAKPGLHVISCHKLLLQYGFVG
jgi:hypothetical protein